MLPTTTERVPLHTASDVNTAIRRQTDLNVAFYAHYAAADRAAIDRRLRELDAEWDIERTLEANAATATLIGVGLGTLVNRRLYALPAVVAGFLLQHALQGWCPPVPLFRRLGFRTSAEINHERYALKALRGDFEQLSGADGSPDSARQALRAVRS